jgi:superfamily II DNA or RNA helicase
METLSSKAPQYIHETEALLMSPYFADEARCQSLYDDYEALATEELGAREVIYAGALRILATAQKDARGDGAWELTPRTIARISVEHSREVGLLARQLAVLNNAEMAISQELGAKGYTGLLDYQRPYLTDILTMLQRGRAPVAAIEEDTDAKIHGILVDAPTGSGKTAVIARTAASIGIGQVPDPNARHPELLKPVRGLLVAPTQALIAQHAGEVGNNTFGQLAPDITVSSFYSENKDMSGDVVVTSPEMFIQHLEDGFFGDEHFDCLFIDEAHHIIEPKFLEALLKHWRGPVIGFTATRKYTEAKDAGNILRYGVHHGDMKLFMEHQRINRLELFTASATPEDFGLEPKKGNFAAQRQRRQKALTSMASDFARTLVAEGRRGLIFCEPGEELLHARNMSDHLNQVQLPGGDSIRAEMIGMMYGSSNSPRNRSAIDRFNNGELDVLATTIMGREGLDLAAVDFIGIATKIGSLLQFQQILGRGTRLSEHFPTTTVGHFIPVGFGQYHTQALTLQRVFGLGSIRQGHILGQKNDTKPARHDFPPELQKLFDQHDSQSCIDGVGREIVFKRNRKAVPLGYLALEDIIDGKDIGHHAARLQLMRSGYDAIQQKQPGSPEGQRDVFFEPAAATFFSETPQPPAGQSTLARSQKWVSREEITTLEEIAGYFGLNTDTFTLHLTEEEKKQGKSRRAAGHDRFRWDEEEATAIKERLERKLFIPAHVLTLTGVSKLLGVHTNTLRKYIDSRQDELGIEAIEARGSTNRAVPWRGIRKIHGRYGLRGEIVEIDFARLPMDSSDKDPAKIAYARDLQKKVLPATWVPAV